MTNMKASRLYQYASKGNFSSAADKHEVLTGIEQLQAENAEYERLHKQLGEVLQYDEESPSLCDLVAVARLIIREKLEMTAHVELAHQLADAVENRDEIPLHKWAVKCGFLVNKIKQSPQQSLAKHDAEVARRAFSDGIMKGFSLVSSGAVFDADKESIQYVERTYGVKDGE